MGKEITEHLAMQFKEHLESNRKSPNTIQKYMADFEKMLDFLDGKELSKETLLAYKEMLMQKDYKKRSINSYLTIANQFCDAMGWQDMKVPLIRLEETDYTTTNKYISAMDYRKLVSTAMECQMEDVAMVIQTLCHVDLRFAELEQLTIDSLQLGIVELKRRDNRHAIYLPKLLNEDLKIYVERHGIEKGTVFQTIHGNAINRSNFWRKLKELCDLAEVPTEKVSIAKLKKPLVEDYYPYYPLRVR